MSRYNIILLIGLLLFIINCKDQKNYTPPKNALFIKKDSTQTGINFVNRIVDTEELNIFSYRNFYNGGGVGIADINNDGLKDIYFTSNLEKNKLYLNKGNFKFEDITEKSHVSGTHAWSTGVVMVDINQDGYMDIYVCNAGNKEGDNRKNELFINQKNLTFKEEAAKYGLDDEGFTTHASFFDYDKDGDLDCYILNNSFIPVSALAYENKRNIKDKDWEVPEVFKAGGDKLLRNDKGKFVDVSTDAGIFQSLQGFGLGVAISDINGDNWPDIYISNDFFERDYLYINQRNGTFKDEFEQRIKHSSISSMGADIQDINNDGKPEIFVSEMLPENDTRLKQTTNFETFDVTNQKQANGFYKQYMQNTLQLNQGNGTFSDIAFYSGTAATDWSWGALIFDMNSDGFNDIYISNGIIHDLTDNDFMDFFANDIIKQMAVNDIKKNIDSIINKMPSTPLPNYAFVNNKNLTFNNQSEAWGLAFPSFSSGASYGDLDNDGDLDVVVNNSNANAFLFENKAIQKGASFVKINLIGDSLNKQAIGSSVYLYTKNGIQKREQYPTRGFQSSVDYDLYFGIPSQEIIDSLVVVWPNDKKQTITNVTKNKYLQLNIKNANKNYYSDNYNYKNLWFEEIATNLLPHKENIYYDFDTEGLIPSMLSTEGPAMAVGDVDNDGKDDLFIGGSTAEKGVLYLYKNGKYIPTNNPLLEKDKGFEDTTAVFVDIDNDKDLDLIVGSGGNALPEGNEYYRDRLYYNNGKGLFTIVNYDINPIRSNTSTIVATDFDKDGWVDLFFGNRNYAKVYGIQPHHVLIKNLGNNKFKNITNSHAKGLSQVGMVTDAAWIDLNQDKNMDLVLVGEWMQPTIFINNGQTLIEQKDTGLQNKYGWWQSIHPTDVDKDGDIDLILGNKGQNHIYKADTNHITKMFIKDYDKNGTTEALFTKYTENKDKPIHSRREIASQIPLLKKDNLKFSEYAKKSFEELFKENERQNVIQKQINENKTIVAINNGKGYFTTKPLPIQAQLSTVYAIQTLDVNQDGYLDIILAGNNYNLRPQFSNDDSFWGDLFLNNKHGSFIWKPSYKTGFLYNGQARNMLISKDKIILGLNNQQPKIYKIKSYQ